MHENGNGHAMNSHFRAGGLAPKAGRFALFEPPPVDAVAVEERAAALGKRSIKKAAKVAGLKLAVRMMDLTTLEGKDTAGKVEQLCQLLDGMYQAGAGEEYLSRLVRASEASASEAKQLKQSLVSSWRLELARCSQARLLQAWSFLTSLARFFSQTMTFVGWTPSQIA